MKKAVYKIQKTSKNLSSLSVSKKSLYKFLLAILFLFVLYPLSSSAQKCSYSLIAKNNIESVNNEGRIYFMELQNNSNEIIAINLSVSNKNSGKNPDQTGIMNNVNLNAKFLTEEGQEIKSTIKLGPNELFKFQVQVTVPAGTPTERWNNLNISATSNNCDGSTTSLVLYTFIPNPDEK
jgi:hypothetical protein